MRRALIGLVLAVFLPACGAGAMFPAGASGAGSEPLEVESDSWQAVAIPEDDPPTEPTRATWLAGAPSQAVVLAGKSEPLYLALWIDTPVAQAAATRSPLDLSLLIDSSGSMAGEKITHARMAAAGLLESLTMGDIVSIYTFADGVSEITPPTVATPDVMSALIASTQQIGAAGSTNMYDGLRVAEARVAEAPSTHPVRRVIVISDGQANVGPSSPQELGVLAARGTETGVQVSAIGVGLDYDERTLGALAVQSSGRLYHLAEPSQMASILDQEVRLLSQTVATDAYLEVIPASGVEIIGAEFAKAKKHGDALRVGLGTLYGSQHREVLIRVKVHGAEASKRPLATARFVYRDASDGMRYRNQDVLLEGSVSADPKAASASKNPRVKAMIARHEAAQAQIKAAEMLNAGQSQQAAEVMASASEELESVAAATPESPERERLEEQAAQLKRTSDSARKANTREKARETALDSYGYAFSDEGFAPAPSVPRPSPRK